MQLAQNTILLRCVEVSRWLRATRLHFATQGGLMYGTALAADVEAIGDVVMDASHEWVRAVIGLE